VDELTRKTEAVMTVFADLLLLDNRRLVRLLAHLDQRNAAEKTGRNLLKTRVAETLLALRRKDRGQAEETRGPA